MSRARDFADLAGSADAGGLTGRNLIINGAMQVSQRGDYTSATAMTNNAYYLDRFKVYLSGVTGTIQHLDDQLVNGSYMKTCKIAATSSASGIIGARQQMEDFHKGKTVTFSAWVRSNTANSRLSVYDGVTSTFSNAHTGGGDFELLTLTKTISTSVSQLACWFYIVGSGGASVSISSGDYIEATQVQLEVGETATPFEHRSYGDELARCQRYFDKVNSVYSTYGASYNYVYWFFKREMRTAPTISGSVTGTADAIKTTHAQRYSVGSSYAMFGSGGNYAYADAEL